MPDALNPNHPVARALDDQWHKLLALVLYRLGYTRIELTEADVEAFTGYYGEDAAVMCGARAGRIILTLVGGPEAARIAREAGGLPS